MRVAVFQQLWFRLAGTRSWRKEGLSFGRPEPRMSQGFRKIGFSF